MHSETEIRQLGIEIDPDDPLTTFIKKERMVTRLRKLSLKTQRRYPEPLIRERRWKNNPGNGTYNCTVRLGEAVLPISFRTGTTSIRTCTSTQ